MRRTSTILLALATAVSVSALPAQAAPAGATSAITANRVSGTVAEHTSHPISGHLSGPGGRVVDLQVEGNNKTWVTTASTITGGAGGYRLPTPTWWVHNSIMRVYAPAVAGYEATSIAVGSLNVRRTWTPRGGTNYTTMFHPAARWNPCRGPITYKINPKSLPYPGAIADIKTAFNKISEATGLRFQYLGTTTYLPMSYREGMNSYNHTADISVAFESAAQSPVLQGNVIGEGAPYQVGNVIVHASVIFRTDAWMNPGYAPSGSKPAWGEDILHELGHAVGLGHSTDPNQIMYPRASAQVGGTYAGGDLRGLAALGAANGCTR